MMGLRARPGLRGFFITWLFGAVFSYLNIFWLNTLVQFNPFIPVGIVALGVAMGLWIALSGWGWSVLRDRGGALAGGLLGAAWWAGSEWLRTLGPYGFPWGLLGISQQPFHPLVQVTSLTGVYGLTFLLVATNGFVADWGLARWSAWELRRRGPAAQGSLPLVRQAVRWAKARVAGAVVVAVILSAWGCVRARSVENATRRVAEEEGTVLTVAVLQPNVMQAVKWESYASPDEARRTELQRQMFVGLLDQLDRVSESGDEVDLVVTPESAVTTPYFNVPEISRRLQDELLQRAGEIGAPILLGADDVILYDREGRPTTDIAAAIDPETSLPWKHDMFVSAWLLPPDRPFDATAVYHKVRLVPFGEWLPWFNVIPGFQENIVQVGSFNPGSGPVLFTVPVRHGGWTPGMGDEEVTGDDVGAIDEEETASEDETFGTRDTANRTERALDRLTPPQVRLATSICFESVFSDLHRWMAREGADVLSNITNDAWYGRTSGPAQHFQIAALRAVETGRPLIRCANTGITAIVSPTGRVEERLPFYEEGTLTVQVPVRRFASLTLYTRWGDWWAVGCLAVAAAALAATELRRRRVG